MNDVCVVELGRYGDIINILPILHHLSKIGEKPALMISREFASILDGVSYVTPHVVDLDFGKVQTAMKLANGQYRTVIQCQIWGIDGYRPDPQTKNFNTESWRMAGFLNEFHNPQWKLVFDRRNLQMEKGIAQKIFLTKKPKIITNLTQAVSAPLPEGANILAEIKRLFSDKYEVVDIGKLRLQHIYDLIGIIERAELFVTLDTATLHLAAACVTPMICIVRDGWEGAEPRYGCVSKFTYSQMKEDGYQKLLTSINDQLWKQ